MRSWRMHTCGSAASSVASATAAARGARLDEPVGEAHALRLLARDTAAGEHEIERVRVADHAGEAHGAAVDERHAPTPAEDAEHRVARRDAQIAPQRELEPTRDRVALDRGDHRLVEQHPRRAHGSVAVFGRRGCRGPRRRP